MINIDKIKEINNLIIEAKNEKNVNEPTSKFLYQKLHSFGNNVLTTFDLNKVLWNHSSIGKGNKNNAPWISFPLIKNNKKNKLKGIYITIVFLAEQNSLFIAIQGNSEKYRTKFLLENIQKFYNQKYNKLNNLLNEKYNILWKNYDFKNSNLLAKYSATDRTNSYLYTSIFYDYIKLDNIDSKNLDNKIETLFNIYFKFGELNYESETLRSELKDFLYYKGIDLEKIDLQNENKKMKKEIQKLKSKNEEFSKTKDTNDHSADLIDYSKIPHPYDNVLKIVDAPKININNSRKLRSRGKGKEVRFQQAKNGERAEEIVKEYEKHYLDIINNRIDLAEKVKILETDGDGYDVRSYNLDGTEKRIEVKSTTTNFFYITNNELRSVLDKSLNIVIYLVLNVNSNSPVIKVVDLSDDFENKIVPDTYKVFFA